MCRLAAYSGVPVPLMRLVSEPDHGLMKQAWAPKEMREAALNADGFGFGWYPPTGEPAVYTSTAPIWSDPNLESLARVLTAPLWLANVRSATPGHGVSHDNTQPFRARNLLFMHNGYVEGFRAGGRETFHRHIDPAFLAHVQGSTDSEFIFALFRECLPAAGGDMTAALHLLVDRLGKVLDGAAALFNLVVCDGRTLLVCRHAFGSAECPSMYVSADPALYPGGIMFASEPLCEPRRWEPLPPHSFMLASNGVRTASGVL